MGKYYVSESFKGTKRIAASKAREDVEEILEDAEFLKVSVNQSIPVSESSSKITRARRRVMANGDWRRPLNKLHKGDVLVIQMPMRNPSMWVAKHMEEFSTRGIKTICIVHDLESLRLANNMGGKKIKSSYLAKLEAGVLSGASAIIVHNSTMVGALSDLIGYDVRNRCVPLGCFDYLVSGRSGSTNRSMDIRTLAVAGNLKRDKAGYAYDLPSAPRFNLYGINWDGEGSENVEYRGSYPADELPRVIEGGFGLVWDGQNTRTCDGLYGDYLRVNNPHKVSLYLASGLPVIIWDKAAMADFILDKHVGFTVTSLYEIADRIDALSEDEYKNMCRNAAVLSKELRAGMFLKRALRTALSII